MKTIRTERARPAADKRRRPPVRRPSTPLKQAVAKLAKYYGTPRASLSDPLQLILYENVAYLADDARRRAAFEQLRRDVGLTPAAILAAPASRLRAVTAHGILPDRFAGKLRIIAQLAQEKFNGDMDEVVRRPAAEAKRALRKFPGIGEPGAEKVLLFSGQQPFLAPDSNALRVLQRLGISPNQRNYARSYAAARDIALAELGRNVKRLQAAHVLLRRHGQEICKRSAPLCAECPLAAGCPRIMGRD